jgi:uncharacterized protein with von Willebrand factor type A (vWA) domain
MSEVHEFSPPADNARWVFASPHDLFVWTRHRRASARLTELAAEIEPMVPTAEPLMIDLFAAFYRHDVRWVPGGATDARVEVNRTILDRVLSSPSYHRLHPDIAGSESDAILVLDAFVRAFASSLDPEMVEFLDAEAGFHAEKARLESEAEAISELVSSKARSRRPTNAGEHSPEEMSTAERRARLAELAAEIEELEYSYRTDFKLRRARAELRQHLDEADVPAQIEAVRDALEEFHQALVTWGNERTPEVVLELDDRLALFRQYFSDARLRRATELLGRANYQAVGAHRTLTRAAPVQISGLALGDDLAALVPSEAVFLVDPDTELEFMRRYAEQELLIRTYELRGEPSRGPVVVLVDESASMAGDRATMAKALALALIGIAGADSREAALIEFSSHGQLRLTHFAPREQDLAQVVEVLTHFFGGGTDFDAPLMAALDLAASDPRYLKADLVIVSDGEAPLHPATVAALLAARDQGARLFAVCVGVDDDTFAQVATRTWPAADLIGEIDDPKLLPDLVAAIH